MRSKEHETKAILDQCSELRPETVWTAGDFADDKWLRKMRGIIAQHRQGTCPERLAARNKMSRAELRGNAELFLFETNIRFQRNKRWREILEWAKSSPCWMRFTVGHATRKMI